MDEEIYSDSDDWWWRNKWPSTIAELERWEARVAAKTDEEYDNEMREFANLLDSKTLSADDGAHTPAKYGRLEFLMEIRAELHRRRTRCLN